MLRSDIEVRQAWGPDPGVPIPPRRLHNSFLACDRESRGGVPPLGVSKGTAG